MARAPRRLEFRDVHTGDVTFTVKDNVDTDRRWPLAMQGQVFDRREVKKLHTFLGRLLDRTARKR